MGPLFYIAQVIGALTTVTVIAAAQMKEMKHIIFMQILANLMVAVSSAMLGGLSGAWICAVAAVQTVVLYLLDKKGISAKTKSWLLIAFAAMYVGGTVLVYQGWGDIISCTGALLYLLSIVQKEAKIYRRYIGVNSLLWLIYDITILAFGNMLTHGFELVSVIVGMIRLDFKKQETARSE